MSRLLGWSTIGPEQDQEWKFHGPRLGWDDGHGTILLDASVVYDTVRRHSRGSITITRGTLYKRLREAGMLNKVDVTRQRNTIRAVAEGATRQVLAIKKELLTEGTDE